VVTRPDRKHGGSDGPTFDENLLGVVMRIERHGKRVPVQPAEHAWLVRRYHALRRALIEAAPRAQLWLAKPLARAQRLALYRKIARCWVAVARPRITYSVQLPLNGKLGESVQRRLTPDEFDPDMEWRGGAIQRWALALYLNDARQPAACAIFARGTDDAWRVEESYVRVRYRSAGLNEALMRQAKAILAKGGHRLSINGD
jgi:hypothetical protein